MIALAYVPCNSVARSGDTSAIKLTNPFGSKTRTLRHPPCMSAGNTCQRQNTTKTNKHPQTTKAYPLPSAARNGVAAKSLYMTSVSTKQAKICNERSLDNGLCVVTVSVDNFTYSERADIFTEISELFCTNYWGSSAGLDITQIQRRR